jgi:hypothetical protein
MFIVSRRSVTDYNTSVAHDEDEEMHNKQPGTDEDLASQLAAHSSTGIEWSHQQQVGSEHISGQIVPPSSTDEVLFPISRGLIIAFSTCNPQSYQSILTSFNGLKIAFPPHFFLHFIPFIKWKKLIQSIHNINY